MAVLLGIILVYTSSVYTVSLLCHHARVRRLSRRSQAIWNHQQSPEVQVRLLERGVL